MRSRWFAATFVVALVGCTVRAYPVSGPDGTQWWSITCSQGQDNCWRKAGQLCPGGYITESESMASRATGVGMTNTGHTVAVAANKSGQMLIKCRTTQPVPNCPEPQVVQPETAVPDAGQ